MEIRRRSVVQRILDPKSELPEVPILMEFRSAWHALQSEITEAQERIAKALPYRKQLDALCGEEVLRTRRRCASASMEVRRVEANPRTPWDIAAARSNFESCRNEYEEAQTKMKVNRANLCTELGITDPIAEKPALESKEQQLQRLEEQLFLGLAFFLLLRLDKLLGGCGLEPGDRLSAMIETLRRLGFVSHTSSLHGSLGSVSDASSLHVKPCCWTTYWEDG